MRPVTRVLVIDDSVFARRVITRAFEREPTVAIVGAMRNSHAAVIRAESLRPDVVLLDSEVAGADGCATLAELRRRYPEMRMVMRGEGNGLSEERVRTDLMPAIRGLARGPAPLESFESSSPMVPARPVEAIVIAASTGGPDALEVLLGQLPAALRVPVFVAQHMPAEFTKLLSERLDRRASLSVAEAADGESVQAGHVYIAPGGRHLSLARAEHTVAVVLGDGPRENGCRPAADVLFRSAAAVYGDQLLAVVLTGMGRDGLLGSQAVRRAGGWVIAQSERSSLIASMPGAVAAAGLANGVVDLETMGDVLTEYAFGRP
jgi:two-component system chemotaxis response regulator CheB